MAVATQNNGDSQFEHLADGMIISVRLENFMTFDDFMYTIHPKFNTLIGLNECGKASAFTALMLGFGWSTRDASGKEHVDEYIKRGKTSSSITIELQLMPTRNIILTRTLLAVAEISNYYIDNVHVPKSEYMDLLKNLNIKVNNLGQFFLQDKLDSHSLLSSAIHSTDDNQLIKSFNKLVCNAESVTKCNEDLLKLQNAILPTLTYIKRLKIKINSFSEEQILECNLVDLLQQKSWLLYVLILKKVKDESEKFENAHKQDLAALSIINKQRVTVRHTVTDLLDIYIMQHKHIKNVLWKELFGDICNIKFSVFEIKDLRKCIRKNLIHKTKQEISILMINEAFEKKKNETFVVEDYKQSLIEINESLRKSKDDITSGNVKLDEVKYKLMYNILKLRLDKNDIEAEKKKEREQNNFLSNVYPKIWKAIQWLRNCDKTIFRGQVFEPLFTQIKVLKDVNAKYIEHIIDNNHMESFVFECKSDFLIFNKIVKQKRWNTVRSVIVPPSNNQISDKPIHDIEDLKKFGFHSYAINLIKTSPIIKRFLIATYNMHNIPIGSKEVITNISHLPISIKTCYADNVQILKTVDKNNAVVSIKQVIIPNESDWFDYYVDHDLIQSMVKKNQDIKKVIEDSKNVQIELTDRLKTSKKDYQYDLARLESVTKIISLSELDLDNFKCSVKTRIDHNQSELERSNARGNFLFSINTRMNESYFTSMEKLVDLLEAYAIHMKLFIAMMFVFNKCRNMNKEEKVLNKLKMIYKDSVKNINDYLNYINCLEVELIQRETNALYWSRGTTLYDKCYQQLNEGLHKIDQSNVEMLNKMIAEKKSRLISRKISTYAPMLLKEYNECKMELKDMEDKFDDLYNYIEFKKNEVERIHHTLFPSVQELCSVLNTNFQRFLASFDCNGLVELHVSKSKYNYMSYGLSISMQLSDNTPLLTLLGDNISNSNKSVLSAMLFWYSLQYITRFPFRVVGKIKQDMDELFERKLMEMLMGLYGNRNEQSLFFITSKLFQNISRDNIVGEIMFSSEN